MLDLVPEDPDGTCKLCLAGVDIPEPIDSDNSGIVPDELFKDISGRELSAVDITARFLWIVTRGTRASEFQMANSNSDITAVFFQIRMLKRSLK